MEIGTSTILNYQKKTLRFVVIIYSISASLAGLLFAFMKFIGLYDEVKWSSIGLLLGIILVELFIFRFMYKKTVKDESSWEKGLLSLKRAIIIISYLNYVYLTFAIPSKELWICVFYFIILGALFLDLKMNFISITISILCQIALFCLNPLCLPEQQVFVRELIIRVVDITLVSFGIYMFTLFASKLLTDIEANEKIIVEKTITYAIFSIKSPSFPKRCCSPAKLFQRLFKKRLVLFRRLHPQAIP